MDEELPITQKRAWVTLLTRPSYLPGAILLAYSLHRQKSTYPLLILTTPSFPSTLLPALKKECTLTNSHHLSISPLQPPKHNLPPALIATRFADTWTKLRVFELYKYGFERLIFLDADMLILRNMDELFDLSIPEGWIAANHACVCNLDGDEWAPEDWRRENCAYTGLKKDSPPQPVPNPSNEKGIFVRTHTLLNSGLFIFKPTSHLWNSIHLTLSTCPKIKTYLFPDQDFLTDFFEGKWKSLGWEFNALKTMRYWHENIWVDNEVRCLHFIVDKPWGRRVGADGVAGYLGNDGVTHGWWWREFERWKGERREGGEVGVLEMMEKEVAPALDGDGR